MVLIVHFGLVIEQGSLLEHVRDVGIIALVHLLKEVICFDDLLPGAVLDRSKLVHVVDSNLLTDRHRYVNQMVQFDWRKRQLVYVTQVLIVKLVPEPKYLLRVI